MEVVWPESRVDQAPNGSVWWAVGLSLLLHGVIVGLTLNTTIKSPPLKPSVMFAMVTLPPVMVQKAPSPAPIIPVSPPPPPVVAPEPEAAPPQVKPQPVVKAVKKPVIPPKVAPVKETPPPVVEAAPVVAPTEPVVDSIQPASLDAASTVDPIQVADASPPPVVTQPDRLVDVRAAYASNPRPAYPPSARRMGYEGTVVLTVQVSGAGAVTGVEIGRSSGFASLDQAAKAAVSQWRFIPARKNGQPVAAGVTVPIRFQLESN